MPALPVNFDPFTQAITLMDTSGAEMSYSLVDVNDIIQENTRQCITFGSQIGATLAVVIILLLLTPPDKRRSPVFWLNTTALLLNFARLLCSTIYYATGYSDVYAILASDFSRISFGDRFNSILGSVLPALLVICIEISLLFQTQVLCATIRSFYRYFILICSILMVLVTIAFRMVQMVIGSQSIMADHSFYSFFWIQQTTNILTTASICYFSAIFVTKLGFAIRARRELGLTGFGAMQVIFIMSCQTMVIPAVFSVLQYVVKKAEMSPLSLTLVVLSLPLSSLWAAQAVKNSFADSGKGASDPRLLFAKGSSEKTSANGTQASTLTTLTGKRNAATDPTDRLYPELENDEIHVERDFTIQSDRA